MTTNHLIGLISAVCLGLVILWTYLRKDKRVWLRMYDKVPIYNPKYPLEVEWWNNDISTHKKVLEDIKKVEEGFLGADQEGINWKYVNPTYPYIDVHSHEKVLEDIKKVEKLNDTPLPPQDHR